MEPEFWHTKWRNNEIAFHEGQANDLLREHIDHLGVHRGDRVFVPLCGKTRDIAFLAEKGLEVVGAELNEQAVVQLFEDMELSPEIRRLGALSLYSSGRISVLVGDIFEVTPDMLGDIAAVYDRAALVALPKDMRAKYARHLVALTGGARQFLNSFTYDQQTMKGPPFSVPEAEVRQHYGDSFDISRVAERQIAGPLAQRCTGLETVWLMEPKDRS